MRNRTLVIAIAAAATAVVAAGSGVAVASSAGAKPSAPAHTVSASTKPGGPAAKAGHEAIVAAVARQLHVSTARASAALRPLFAAGHAELSSPALAAAVRSLGVSTQQLSTALTQAKLSLAGSTHGKQHPVGSKTSSAEQAGHEAIVAAVARQLHVSTARASAALRPLFAAGHAELSSPALAAAARSLGVSTQQLSTALTQAKLSLAGS